jgi:signal transduction histidine kinase/DNA-binding response OmpR family regulator
MSRFPFSIDMKLFARFLVCYLLWGLVSQQVCAQNQAMIDSLQHLLETGVSANKEVNVYVNLAEAYLFHDSLLVVAYANQAIELAEDIDYPKGKIDAMNAVGQLNLLQGDYPVAEAGFIEMVEASRRIHYQRGEARGWNGLGTVYLYQGDNPQALTYFLKGLALYEAEGRKLGVASSYNNIANIYFYQGDFENALDYLLKTLHIHEEFGNQRGIATAYFNIAGVYGKQGRQEQALAYYLKALEIEQSLENQSFIAEIYNEIGSLLYEQDNKEEALGYFLKALHLHQALGAKAGIASTYRQIGTYYQDKKQDQEALSYYDMALEISEELEDKVEIARLCNNIGNLYRGQGNAEKAMAYLTKAMTLAKEIQANPETCFSLIIMAELYQEQGDYLRAKKYLVEAMSLAQEMEVVSLIRRAARTLSSVEARLGNYQAAYQHHVLFKQMADSLQNEAQTRNIARLEAEYEFKQERDSIQFANQTQRLALENDIAQARTIQRSAFIAISLLVILLLVLFLFHKSSKRANQLLTQQAEQLKTLDEAKSRFFANVSHELRTPLTLVSSPLTQVLTDAGPQLAGPHRQLLTLAQENSFQLKELVDDILDLSRLENSQLQLSEQRVNLGALIQLCASNFDSLAQHLLIHHEIRMEDALRHTWVLLDRKKFEKVLNNLLSNAIKFTPSQGRVSLEAQRQDRLLRLTVCDTGAGIDPEDLPHIFDRFTQSQQPERMMQGGSGIGLAIAKEYTQLMQGHITVESERGKGSTFTLTLPLREVEPPVAEEATEAALTEEDHSDTQAWVTPVNPASPTLEDRTFTILIVEDHPQMQQFVRSLLQPRFRTLMAHNGVKALEVLEQEPVDLIISDVMMPQMDGFALVEHLKRSEAYFRLPIILLTALGGEEHKLKGLMLGVNDYLPKPFFPQELWVRVHNLLQRSLAAQEEEAEDAIEVPATDAASVELEVHPRDLAWLQEVKQAIEAGLPNEQFLISDLAEQFHLSERQFRRKLKQLTGLSPKQYQQEIALQTARELLEGGQCETVKAAAYSVGMQSPARFSKLYEARFGKKPSELVGR